MPVQTPPVSGDLDADYVIVGAGAVGLAFADTLASETDASMVIVDRRHAPGGHWVDGYPFLQLHTSSTLYGVASVVLGAGGRVAAGRDRGQEERASRAEICAYYDRVMHDRLLATGRVTYLPLSDYTPDGRVVSRASGTSRRVTARRRVVEATYAGTRVPATHPPPFPVAGGARLVTPGELVDAIDPGAHYVIIGGGKTSMDTAAWLLEMGVDPEAITWIRPREAWLLNRDRLQTDTASFAATFGGFAAEMEAARDAASLADLLQRLEAAGQLLRIDPGVEPAMFRCATVGEAELAQLRRIRRVVRLGHVRRIEADRIVLAQGEVATPPRTVHVHCCADGIPPTPPQPLFRPGRILVQYLRRCAPSLSGAMVAKLEATIDDDARKNALALPVPVPAVPRDWMRMQVEEARNNARWAREPALREWLQQSRLNPYSAQAARAAKDPAHAAIVERYRQAMTPAYANLERLLAA